MVYWRVIWKRRWLIVGIFWVAVLTAMVIGLRTPKIYQSTASLLPSVESSGGGGGLGGMLGGGAGGAAQSLGITLPGVPVTPTDLFVALLKSRIMADAVIKEFDLQTLYGATMMQDARQALEGSTKIMLTKEKVVTITVEATNPQLAADMANFYVANLDRLNRTLNTSKAGSNRRFIEQRLTETLVNLTREEEEMKQFQLTNKTVAVEAQSSALMTAAGQVQGQIMAQEVQLQVMSSYLSPDNPELARVRTTLNELRKQLYLLESGKGGKGMLPGDRLHPAMITVPGLALDYTRAMRELKVQETLYAMLVSQLEQAKLTEARDTPTVQVLDPAIPAERKSRPRVGLNMMFSGGVSIFIGILLAFALEYVGRVRDRRKEQLAVEPQRIRINP